MRWAEGFIAVDWGTTNRRAYLLDGGGNCSSEFEDDQGILAVEIGGFPAAVQQIRDRLGDLPLLLGGMIGSNRGWVEAPYAYCPAGLDDLAAGLVAAGDRCAIVPGVAYADEGRADVMRGEEIQLVGAVAAGLVPADCIVCHPGTHNKWVRMEAGRIATFRTVMTGELFNLLRQHSILSNLLSGEVSAGESFAAGVRRGLADGGITAELFTLRARVLLGQAAEQGSACFASGLLIGEDIRVGMKACGEGVLIVMGRPELTELYAAALAEAGRPSRQVDGETAFIEGIKCIAERIE
ncbi:MAG TPA: 2-dehydro-3-deoxygalactonokinase [Sphingomicrobium sp.]|nr:2-dehydro-3-deoxygalactonokinase [Sphingomicrobium sp.]